MRQRVALMIALLTVVGALSCRPDEPLCPPPLPTPHAPPPGDDDSPNAWPEGDLRWENWMVAQKVQAHLRLAAPSKADLAPPHLTPSCNLQGPSYCVTMYRWGYDTVTKCRNACGQTYYLVEISQGEGCVIRMRVDAPGIPSEPIEECS